MLLDVKRLLFIGKNSGHWESRMSQLSVVDEIATRRTLHNMTSGGVKCEEREYLGWNNMPKRELLEVSNYIPWQALTLRVKFGTVRGIFQTVDVVGHNIDLETAVVNRSHDYIYSQESRSHSVSDK